MLLGCFQHNNFASLALGILHLSKIGNLIRFVIDTFCFEDCLRDLFKEYFFEQKMVECCFEKTCEFLLNFELIIPEQKRFKISSSFKIDQVAFSNESSEKWVYEVEFIDTTVNFNYTLTPRDKRNFNLFFISLHLSEQAGVLKTHLFNTPKKKASFMSTSD